jgi:hypothetical protein
MSTRSIIGVGSLQSFKAQYCHSDGYPTGNGKTLWENWTKTFDGDLQKLADFILSSKCGWSYIAGCDFSLQPRWMEWDEMQENPKRARWYDDRTPIEQRGHEYYWTEANLEYGLFDPEWVYLMDIEADEINVYAVECEGLVFRGKIRADETPDFEAMEAH